MSNEWYAVYVVGENFQLSEAVAMFRYADHATEWGRDNYPYQYLVKPVPDGAQVVDVHYNPNPEGRT